jgi:spoIIIJ-associated protein
MTEERATLEMIAPTIEEAIADGLAELGLSIEEVNVETLDEGNKGILGLGSRHARVLLTIKSEADVAQSEVKHSAPKSSYDSSKGDNIDNLIAIAEATVSELLEKMQVSADVKATLNEEDSTDEYPSVNVDISGNDLSILIGRRAETLNALQYITRLIVGKEIGHGARVNIDIEGYRARREQSLNQLAERMAKQAIKSGRKQSLEPMPPNERRLVHMALRDFDDVETESVGEDPRRKVVIIPNV